MLCARGKGVRGAMASKLHELKSRGTLLFLSMWCCLLCLHVLAQGTAAAASAAAAEATQRSSGDCAMM